MNWLIWAVAALLVIGAVGSLTTKPATTTAADRSRPPSSSPPASSGNPTPQSSPGTSTSSTRHTPTRKPSTPRPADTTGGDVVTASGAVLPNPARTPGAVNPNVTQADIGVTICVTGWTDTIRPPSSYTSGLKEQQLATGYADRGDQNSADYEEDHLISLELGGAPRSPLNLWPEPYFATDGARMKDQIENRLHTLVCAGTLSLATARHAIATNWYAAYRTYVGHPAPVTTSHSNPPPAPTTTAAPPPTNPLTCRASMSNPNPSDYSTTDAIVHTGVAGAAVTATAHYKTTDTTHSGTADTTGAADIAFRISRATPGYTVTVDVTVSANGASKYCSTAFTPE